MKLRKIIANWTPAQWEALLLQYQLPVSCLTGNPGPCPICGGTDRFTYDNKSGRGDWVCRKCKDGSPMAGDGLQLICRFTGMSFIQLALEIEGSVCLHRWRSAIAHCPLLHLVVGWIPRRPQLV
ncbi:primase-helicase zinc-binding domain-containing protein [Cupriavidus sp. D39]|uniref:primase-helicase zinc-binding domain-containing protein n=1 Tax=Cupriavidus sp. D39 TaxID=2997877 RepID=UPI002271F4D0|nr:primase-helicase zinc-binding domain-containing protein [Cupriavidus sp. D39]MCY0854245.1 hypothetical protein [Cupriavidus sp. D39]